VVIFIYDLYNKALNCVVLNGKPLHRF